MKKVIFIVALLLLIMTNCHRSKNRFAEGLKNEQADSIELDLTENDSFTVVYR